RAPSRCPKCGCDDSSMLELEGNRGFCNNCSHDWKTEQGRFRSIDDLVARSGLRRDELVTLADIGALNTFGYDRRSALWQAEQAVRPSGELFTTFNAELAELAENLFENENSADSAVSALNVVDQDRSPLKPMTEVERLVADYAGTGLTVGRHPMALRRDELATRGVMRACDLRTARHGRRGRGGGRVITRQPPGTAEAFLVLPLPDRPRP